MSPKAAEVVLSILLAGFKEEEVRPVVRILGRVVNTPGIHYFCFNPQERILVDQLVSKDILARQGSDIHIAKAN